MNIKPLNEKLVIKRMDADDVTPGGIVLPDTAKEKPKRGVVKAVGCGRLLDSGERAVMQTAVGKEVIFTSYAGVEIKIDGEEYLIMDESDVLGVIE